MWKHLVDLPFRHHHIITGDNAIFVDIVPSSRINLGYILNDFEWLKVPMQQLKIREGSSQVLVNDQIYVLGGRRNHQMLDSFKIWSPNKLQNISARIPPRADHLCCITDSKLVVFGGRYLSIPTNEVWIFCLKSHRWELKKTIGERPLARYHASGIILDETLWISGGTDGQQVFQDLYSLDLLSGNWLKHSPKAIGVFHSEGQLLVQLEGSILQRYPSDYQLIELPPNTHVINVGSEVWSIGPSVWQLDLDETKSSSPDLTSLSEPIVLSEPPGSNTSQSLDELDLETRVQQLIHENQQLHLRIEELEAEVERWIHEVAELQDLSQAAINELTTKYNQLLLESYSE